jgi:hypothetical protein
MNEEIPKGNFTIKPAFCQWCVAEMAVTNTNSHRRWWGGLRAG